MISKTVLIVEDEEAIREVLATWLEDAGYQTCCASNGLEGLQELHQRHPDLLVTDIFMPQMDGFELCRLVREFDQMPIIMLTGLGKESDRDKGLQLGADDYVMKPVDMDEFLDKVAAVLQRRRGAGTGPVPGPALSD